MISIYTLNGYINYGNRLQLYALSKTIESLKREEVSVFWPRKKIDILKEVIKIRTPFCILFPKERKLKNFTKKYIPKLEQKNTNNIRVAGSDQVWNPNYFDTRPYLLCMGDNGINISYAASMGVDVLTGEQKKLFKDALKDYSQISVREKSAKKLLQPLTKKKIEVVLDPTLLLRKADYEALEKRPNNLEKNEKYILCYILGNRDHEEVIEKFAEKKGYKTIYFSDKRDSNYGIEEFLYLIHHAQLICTDSFHACVFSFIFERPFVAFKRTGKSNYMYTRLQNLIETFKLKNREYDGSGITKENLEVDYSDARKILKKEQEKSLDFLKRALEIKDEK